MKNFRRVDIVGTKLEQFVLWALTALVTVFMAYVYYEVTYEEPIMMWFMIAAAALHFIVDIVIYIDKKIDEFLEKEEEE